VKEVDIVIDCMCDSSVMAMDKYSSEWKLAITDVMLYNY